MFFKKTALLLTSLCFSLFLSTQANAGGVFYSTEGDTIRVPNDTQMIIILKKGTEITAVDARGNAIAPCETCEKDLENTKMLVTLNKDGNLDVIGGTPPKNARNKATATQAQDDFIQTVTEGIKLRKITKQQGAQYGLLLNREGKMDVVNINTSKLLQPNERQNPSSQKADKNHAHDNKTATERPPLSDAEFAELKRKFDRTIAVEVTRGSECIEFIDLGMRFRDCSPNSPKWW